MRRMFAAASAAVVLIFGANPALAWGDEGHKVVGRIAYDLLTPTAKMKIDQLLAADTDPLTPTDFPSRATWADKYRDSNQRRDHYAQTHLWHFADLEISAPDLAQACYDFPVLPAGVMAADQAAPARDCAPNKIDQFLSELSNPNTPQAERIMALKFVMHFVGDIHQPLHAADDHDAGGNCEQVRMKPGGRKMALHHFWDTETVNALLISYRAKTRRPDATLLDMADAFRRSVSVADRTTWEGGDPRRWTQESFGWAQQYGYDPLPPHPACAPQNAHSYPPFVLPRAYQADAVNATEMQLKKGGVRLAAVLNQAFS